MIARCQKRRRTRIAKGGQVFNEQAIWGNSNGLLVFVLRSDQHYAVILRSRALARRLEGSPLALASILRGSRKHAMLSHREASTSG
jgi:hypothetical protein